MDKPNQPTLKYGGWWAQYLFKRKDAVYTLAIMERAAAVLAIADRLKRREETEWSREREREYEMALQVAELHFVEEKTGETSEQP